MTIVIRGAFLSTWPSEQWVDQMKILAIFSLPIGNLNFMVLGSKSFMYLLNSLFPFSITDLNLRRLRFFFFFFWVSLMVGFDFSEMVVASPYFVI